MTKLKGQGLSKGAKFGILTVIVTGAVVIGTLISLKNFDPFENERAVLLLRNVFDCDYDELAAVISNRADTCRQSLRRARQHLADARARLKVSPKQLQKLARQFTLTSASGDLKGLVTALA